MKATECKQKHKSHWFIHLLPAHIHTHTKFRKVSRFAWRTETFYDSSRCVCASSASAWSEVEKINWKIKVGFISLRFMAGICLEVRWIRFESLSAKQCFLMWWWAGKGLKVDVLADGKHQTSCLAVDDNGFDSSWGSCSLLSNFRMLRMSRYDWCHATKKCLHELCCGVV